MAGFEQNVSNEDLWRKLWGVNAFKITTARILKTRTKSQQLRKKRRVLFTSQSLKLCRNLAKNVVRAVTMLLHVYVMPTYPVISIAVFLYVY